MEYGMFTQEGNQLVQRIAEAGAKLAQTDGERAGWIFARRELRKLSYAAGFEEAMDTMVREIVYGDVAPQRTVDFYV